MARARSRAKNAKDPPLPTTVPLSSNERIVEVIFHADLVDCDPALPNSVHRTQLSVLLMGEKHTVHLRDCIVTASAEPTRGKKSTPPPPPPPRPTSIHVPLVQQRHTISLELLRRMCDKSSQHTVEFFLPALSSCAKPPPLSTHSAAASPTQSTQTAASGPSVSGGALTSRSTVGQKAVAAESLLAAASHASVPANTARSLHDDGKDGSPLSRAARATATMTAGGAPGLAEDARRGTAGGQVCLARTSLQLVDILQSTTARYDETVLLSSSFSPSSDADPSPSPSPLSALSLRVAGLAACWLELRCGDRAMLTRELVQRYRPVCVTLYGCERALRPLGHAAPSMPETNSAAGGVGRAREDDAVLLLSSSRRLVVDCLGHVCSAWVRNSTNAHDIPYAARKDCAVQRGDGTRGCEADKERERVGGPSGRADAAAPRHVTTPSPSSHASETGRMAPAPVSPTAWLARAVYFLADAEPLQLYRSLQLEVVEVSLLEEEAGATRAVPIGYGSFSLADYLSHRQTCFHVTVPLLPRRHTRAATENCLSCDYTAVVRVDFFDAPFPALVHVNRRGEAVSHRFLARAIVRMPHTAPWVAHVLSRLLRALRGLAAVRAGRGSDCDRGGDSSRTVCADGSGVYAVCEADRGSGVVRLRDEKGLASEATAHAAGMTGTAATYATVSSPSPTLLMAGHSRAVGGGGTGGTCADDSTAALGAAAPARTATAHATPATATASDLDVVASAYERPLRVVSCPGVTGFEVMDASRRVICLEAPVHELRRVLRAVAQAAEEMHCRVHSRCNDAARREMRRASQCTADALDTRALCAQNTRDEDRSDLFISHEGAEDRLEVLFNAELFVPTRLYTSFPPLVTAPEPKRETGSETAQRRGGDSALLPASRRHAVGGGGRGSAPRRGHSSETAMSQAGRCTASLEQSSNDHKDSDNDNSIINNSDCNNNINSNIISNSSDKCKEGDLSNPHTHAANDSQTDLPSANDSRESSLMQESEYGESDDCATSQTVSVEGHAGDRAPSVSSTSSTTSATTHTVNSSIASTSRSHDRAAPAQGSRRQGSTHHTADESEAGGTGGRIQRIRLCETLPTLMRQQRHLLHRTLSESCLSCLHKLHALSRCTTLRAAVEHRYFPSSTELIALERAFGQTLELEDVFGQANFVLAPSPRRSCAAASPTGGRADGASCADSQLPSSAWRADGPHVSLDPRAMQCVAAVDVHQLRASDVGRLVSFTAKLYRASDHRACGTRATASHNICGTTTITTNTTGDSDCVGRQSTSRRRRIPAAVAERFTRVLWLSVEETPTSEPVMCALDASTTMHDVIQYAVEAQVIEYAGVWMLYVISLSTLSVSQTSSRNVTYEADLRRRRAREQRQRHEQRKQRQHEQHKQPPRPHQHSSKTCSHTLVSYTPQGSGKCLPSLAQTKPLAVSMKAAVRDQL